MEMQQAEPEFDREMEEKILCENSPESIGTSGLILWWKIKL